MQYAERRIMPLAGAGLIVLLLAGCGNPSPADDRSSDKPKQDQTSSPATSVALDTTARPAKYTGSGQSALDVKVAPASLKRGTSADLANVRLDDDMLGKVPYYLTVSVTNTATATVDAAKAVERFALAFADGTRGQSVSFFNSNPLGKPGAGPLDTCVSASATAKLAADKTATGCQIIMVPKDAKPSTVSYRDDSGTRTWKVQGGDGQSSGILPAGRPAKATWTDTYDKQFPLTVTPKSVRKVGQDALAGYDLNAEQKNADLYFVTVEYRNGGTAQLLPSMDEAVDLRTEAGQSVQKMSLIAVGSNGPKGCESSVPYGMLQPGKTVRQCGVYLIGKGDKPVTMTFTPTTKGTKPLTWKSS